MFVSSLLDYVVRHYQCQQANIDVGNVVITIHTGANTINLLPVNTGFYLIVVAQLQLLMVMIQTTCGNVTVK
jgi:hypothetical protein